MVAQPPARLRPRLSERLKATKKKEDNSGMTSTPKKQTQPFKQSRNDEGSRCSLSTPSSFALKPITLSDRRSFLAERKIQREKSKDVRSATEKRQIAVKVESCQVRELKRQESNQEKKAPAVYSNYPNINTSTRRRSEILKAMRKGSNTMKSSVPTKKKGSVSTINTRTQRGNTSFKSHVKSEIYDDDQRNEEQIARRHGSKNYQEDDSRDHYSSDFERHGRGSFDSKSSFHHLLKADSTKDVLEMKRPKSTSGRTASILRNSESPKWLKSTQNIDDFPGSASRTLDQSLTVQKKPMANDTGTLGLKKDPLLLPTRNTFGSSQQYTANSRDRAKEIIARRRNQQAPKPEQDDPSTIQNGKEYMSYLRESRRKHVTDAKQSPARVTGEPTHKMEYHAGMSLSPHTQTQMEYFPSKNISFSKESMRKINAELAKLEFEGEKFTTNQTNYALQRRVAVPPHHMVGPTETQQSAVEASTQMDEKQSSSKAASAKVNFESENAQTNQANNTFQGHGAIHPQHMVYGVSPPTQISQSAAEEYSAIQLDDKKLSKVSTQTNQSYKTLLTHMALSNQHMFSTEPAQKMEYYGMFHPTQTQQSTAEQTAEAHPSTQMKYYPTKQPAIGFQAHGHTGGVLNTPANQPLIGYRGRHQQNLLYQNAAMLQSPPMAASHNHPVSRPLPNPFPAYGPQFPGQFNSALQMSPGRSQISRPTLPKHIASQARLDQLNVNPDHHNFSLNPIRNGFSSMNYDLATKKNTKRLYASATENKTKDSSQYASHSGSDSSYASFSGSSNSHTAQSDSISLPRSRYQDFVEAMSNSSFPF
jgi:hypothetical protein